MHTSLKVFLLCMSLLVIAWFVGETLFLSAKPPSDCSQETFPSDTLVYYQPRIYDDVVVYKESVVFEDSVYFAGPVGVGKSNN